MCSSDGYTFLASSVGTGKRTSAVFFVVPLIVTIFLFASQSQCRCHACIVLLGHLVQQLTFFETMYHPRTPLGIKLSLFLFRLPAGTPYQRSELEDTARYYEATQSITPEDVQWVQPERTSSGAMSKSVIRLAAGQWIRA
ncbi:hypothetical protein DAEQUDRAFT_734143 [Daedalea quercina L-15889]|uniref:Uncharacterized protein n=1 Tax=Daedalea quercina L-15889 TaxID=1314783 RepID=A0A165KHY1_9APHY|nr:hypothetical protein DAEQUDRAFT_734143 [Daedalea quercina L-15889]